MKSLKKLDIDNIKYEMLPTDKYKEYEKSLINQLFSIDK